MRAKHGAQMIREATNRYPERMRHLFSHGILLLFAAAAATLLLTSNAVPADDTSVIERRLTRFIKEFYGEGEEIQVKFTNLSQFLKERTKVKTVNFSRVPDAQGDGVCLVEFESKDARERNAYVGFKIFKKKRLFVLKRAGKKGDILGDGDVTEKETYLTGATVYPSSRADVMGKKLKRDTPAGTVIMPPLLEDQVFVERGEIVSIIAENSRLAIHTNGKALDKGRMGETIRVKNLSSGKEVHCRVTGSNTVAVEF